MDFAAIGRGLIQMKQASLAQVVESPRLDLRHYTEQEQIYTDWVQSLGEAGVVAPNLMVACLVGIACMVWGMLLPRRWTWLLVLTTLAWAARSAIVADQRSAGV